MSRRSKQQSPSLFIYTDTKKKISLLYMCELQFHQSTVAPRRELLELRRAQRGISRKRERERPSARRQAPQRRRVPHHGPGEGIYERYGLFTFIFNTKALDTCALDFFCGQQILTWGAPQQQSRCCLPPCLRHWWRCRSDWTCEATHTNALISVWLCFYIFTYEQKWVNNVDYCRER